MAVLMALIRGLTRHNEQTLGNFWVDIVRGVVYILLPLAFILAIILSAQGVIQSLNPDQSIATLETTTSQQRIPMGPVASQTAISQLGSNGGGFFGSNAAHPLANPTPLTNFFELLAMLLIPAALCYTFGVMIKDTRQTWAILMAMFCLLIPFLIATCYNEYQGYPNWPGPIWKAKNCVLCSKYQFMVYRDYCHLEWGP